MPEASEDQEFALYHLTLLLERNSMDQGELEKNRTLPDPATPIDRATLPSALQVPYTGGSNALPLPTGTYRPVIQSQASASTSQSALPPEDDCSQCSLIYEYVSVYYPPAAQSNTDCLNGLPPPQPTLPTDLNPQPGSAYVVIPSLSAGNNCTLLAAYSSQTFTFGPGQLSTIQGPSSVTKEFNFADLPCPPPEVAADETNFYNPAVNPTKTYAPIIAPFQQLFDLNPAFHNCIVGANQGIDPSTALPVGVPTIPNPHDHFGPHRREILPRDGSPTNAHNVARLPNETVSPKKG
ncbi:MAG: hypothetical protein Q9202_002281 [Teloschistes flavicans]